jgi:hypothetical protein
MENWHKCIQVVCKCGWHTGAYDINVCFGWGAFNAYLDEIGAYNSFWFDGGDFYRANNKCPSCKTAFENGMTQVTGWNKYATDKQVKLLTSLGIPSPDTLIHESIQYILQQRKVDGRRKCQTIVN